MGEDLFSTAGAHVLAIGVGRLGGEAASGGALADASGHSLPRALWAAADSDAAHLIATGLDHKLHIPLARGAFAAKSAAQGIAACEGELASVCAGKNVALVFGSADEEPVAAILPELASELRRRELAVCVVAAGGDASSREGARGIADGADVVLRIPAGGTDDPLEPAVGGARELRMQKLLAAVQALAGVLSQAECGGFSVEKLREVLRGSGPVFAAVGQADGPAAVPRAFELAAEEAAAFRALPEHCREREVAEPLDPIVREPALDVAVAVLAGSAPSRAEVRDVAQYLGRFATSRAPLVGFQRHADLDDEAICLVMLRHAASRNVVALMSA
jgi:hypothetical protein